MHELESEKSVLDKEKLAILFREMLQMCLWGNATDLSLLTHMSADDIEHLQSVGRDAQAERQKYILKDDQEQLWNYLSSLEEGRVDFVLDNSGFELFTDFVFADFLVTHTPYVSKVYFHPKLIPWFVSDVTPPDFAKAITSLLDPSFFPVGKDAAPSNPEHLTHMVTRWKGYMEQGIFNLSVPNDTPLGGNPQPAEFWTSPWPYWNMETHASDLFATLKRSDLVIFKASNLAFSRNVNAQMRRLGPLAGSFPLLSLRTNKADVVVGVDKETAERLDASSEKWRVDGRRTIPSVARVKYLSGSVMRQELTALPLLLLVLTALYDETCAVLEPSYQYKSGAANAKRHVEILILGGGVAGVIAARTLHQHSIDDFLVVEARDELGGRLRSKTFAGKTIELGANWIQGTQTGDGPENPILTLAKKHNLKTQLNDQFGSMTTYDNTGAVDYLEVFNASIDTFSDLIIYSGERLSQNLVDLSIRSTYELIGAKPRDVHAKAAEYFNVDFEYAQKPDQSSAIASSWNDNFTYTVDQGGFSEDNFMSIDQRGFKAFIQEESKEFLKAGQLLLNSTIKTISWSGSGATIGLKDGSSISADYVICTFSLGVLQNDDVQFLPRLPVSEEILV
ncbi:hypothetical protein C0991_011562 [Blastosporella zonata]|nr:hypothetical protein C0991_011562 [Blastosporella zonata]